MTVYHQWALNYPVCKSTRLGVSRIQRVKAMIKKYRILMRHNKLRYSFQKPVYDIAWSPRSSTVFACVNDGAVEVWDLNVST